jgi:ADP-L-glycero-D-manno-heptose 6-epimerase
LTKIIAVDNLSKAEKTRTWSTSEIVDYIDKQDFIERIQAGHFDGESKPSSMRAPAPTTKETDGLLHDGEQLPLTPASCSTGA